MSRNRLLGLLAAILLGLTSSPATALEASVPTSTDGPVIQVVTLAESAARENAKVASLRKAADPIIDEGIDGVGHVMVELDEEEQSITVGVGVDALGLDESVTLGMPGGGSEEGTPPDSGEAEVPGAAAAGQKAEMDQAKADAGAAAAAARRTSPAFASDSTKGAASGSVSTGTGTGRSVRPSPAAPDPDGDTAADILVADQNPFLRLLGMMMVAGTAGAWSFAKRHGLA